MAYTVKNMEGRMFKNSRKERASQPDMTGSFVIDDQDFRLAGWWTTPKNNPDGEKYLNLKISVMGDAPTVTPPQPTTPEVREELNLAADDLPF